MGDYSHNYLGEVKRTEGTTDYIDYVFELKKAPLDDSLAPVDILGSDGVEFGIIADTYIQNGHTETNFAVKNFDHNANIEIFGSGEGAMPFYAGNIVNQLRIDGDTNVDCDVFYATEDDSKVTLDVTKATATKYPTTRDSINKYVEDILSDGTRKSSELADKTTVTPGVPTDLNGVPLDFTGFPDHKTIYVDASNLTGAFKNTSGIKIQKKKNQSIVFNFSDSGTLEINKFEVETYDDNGNKIDSVDSATVALDGDPTKNNKIDQMIFEHITFNAPNASTVKLTDWSGLLLAPNADIQQKNSGGWLLTNQTVQSGSGSGEGAEFHFYRHERHYKSKGDFTLSGQKRIMEGETSKNYSDFASMKFEFELYECNENGDVAAGAKAIEKVAASSTDGKFSFNKLKYTEADFNGVEQGANGERIKPFYYVIQEVSSGGKSGSVNYDAAPVYVKVVATDTPSAEGSGKGEISFEIYTASKPAEGGQWEWALARKTGTEDVVYEIGNFDNTYEEQKGSLKVKKTVNGDDAKGTYKIAVKNSEGHYFDTDGSDKGTEAFYVEFSKNDEKTWANLTKGTYTVEEEDASVTGYTWTVEGTGNVAVTAGGEASKEVTNTYERVVTGTATIKVEKAVSGTRWPNGGEVTFTIARQAGEANTEAPLPDPLTTEVQTEAGEKNFSAVTLGKKDIGKIYYYEITENAKGFDVNAGWSVTPEKIIVKMEVGQPDDQAHLNPTVTYSINGGKTYGRTRSFYTITNKYESSGEINLEVNKKMVGRPISSSVDKDKGRFAFDLYIYDPTVRGTGDGESPLTNYRYVGTVNCDSTGIAKFLAEDAQFKNDLTFNQNDIESWSIDGTGTGKKKFKVLEVIPDDATENEDGIFSKDGYTYDSSIKSITVNLKDYGNGHIDAEVVKEESDELEFTNKYAAEGEIVLHAQKKLIGARKLEEGQFTFELIEVIEKDDSEVENVIDTKKNDAKGTVTFDPIKYTQEDIYDVDEDGVYSGPETKDFRYKIREVIPKGAVDNMDGTFYYEGYTYDATVYELVVTATDNGDGTITAVDAADEATDGQKPAEEKYVFVNAYEAVGGLKLNAEKTYKNGTLRGGEFTFELRDADGKVLQSRKNDAAGHVYFEPLDYELEDAAKSPFTYTVREVPGSRTDVKYDATVYTVTVSLEDNGDGTLKVTKKIDNGGALKFVNEQLNVETSVTIGGEKILKGGTLKNGQFKFVLADANGKWVDTATNDAEGNYDKTVYTVKVTVTDNGDGTMTAKADKAKSDIKFVNREEKKKKDNTKTGDEAPLGVLFGGLGIGAAGLAVLLEDRKRRNRNK